MYEQFRFRWARATACMVCAVARAAHAQGAGDATISGADALRHDLATAAGLVDRQLAIPFASGGAPLVLLAALALAVGLAWPVRMWVLARFSALMARAPMEPRLALRGRAAGTVFISTVFLILAGQIGFAAIVFTHPVLPEIKVLVHSLAIATGVAGLGLGLGRALRSPDDKTLRPVQFPSGLGQVIEFYPFAASLTLGVTNFVDQVARAVNATQTTWTIVQILTVVIESGIIARFLVLLGEARQRETDAAAGAAKQPEMPAIFGITALAWAALAVAWGTYLFGNTRLALLIVQELLWMGLVLPAAWVLATFFDALVAQLFDEDWTIGRFTTTVIGVRRARVKQMALLASALLTVIVWLFALALISGPLHGDRAVVIEQIRPALLVQSFQALQLSPRTAGTAVMVLVIGIALTRMLREWLENRFLPSTSLDIGVRNSLVTGLTYVGIIIALLAATSMLGLQLEKITLIASALSVGIGFGLQSIIQNFVSGVILLIERPVKVGDWIAVAGAEGTIRRIRVRATELATADGGIAIVPNSSFISANVANRRDTLMPHRLDLALTVSGCASAASARDAVLAMVTGCTLIREMPAPQVLLATLDEAQWVFNLRVYARPDTSLARARSELLFWLSAQTEGTDLKIKSA